MKKLCGWICFMMLALGAAAQPVGIERLDVMPEPRPFPVPVLKVEAEKPIQLRSLDVKIMIRGLQAETTQTMVFHNPNGRQLAGDLQFPLPDGATVSGYALDVQGRLVDGVIVTKQKARVILEAEQRRRVDPGLVEHVRGNQFNTRVFPIPARGQRTIRVTYVSDLRFVGDDAMYELPLPRDVAIPEVSIELTIDKGPVKPELGEFGNLTLKDWNDQWHATTRIRDAETLGDLTVRLPKLPRSWSATETYGNETFVALMDRPDVKSATKILEPPTRFALAWDASGSRTEKALVKELTLLKGMLSEWPETIVDLLVLRNQPEAVISFTDHKKLMEYLEALPMDGGTDLSTADLRKKALPHADDAFWVLVSDGLYTLGGGLPSFDAVPVYCLSAEPSRDMGVLRFIAAATQGEVFDGLRAKAEDLVGAILDAGKQKVQIEDPDGVLADIQKHQDSVSGVMRVYAKVRKKGTVALVYTQNGKEVNRRSFEVSVEDAGEGGLLARAWAGQKANALSVFPDENAMELRMLGNRYKLVTPGTSLLVLESLDQYLRYEVEPPATWPEMRSQYAASIKSRQSEEKSTVDNKITQVAGWWQERVAWWEREFDLKTIKKNKLLTAVNALSPGQEMGASRDEELQRGPALMLRESNGQMENSFASSPARRMDVAEDGAVELEALEDLDTGGKKLKQSGVAATVALQAWSPDTPYLKAISKKGDGSVYSRYLVQRKDYATSPAFYLDCAGHVLKTDREKGLRILSNLAEMKLENAGLLRIYAWRLQEAGELDRSIELLERVLSLRPDEPQSHRDLALALILRYDKVGDFADAERAGTLLYEVISGQWARFQQIELLACVELNRLIESVPKKKRSSFDYVDKRLRKNLDVDLRIVLSWDADNTDIDLHVVEPSGETGYYSNNRTQIGGYVSRDFTQGYGPEDYFVRKGMPGAYEIKCKYYGSSQQTLIGPATVTATVFTNYGREDETRQVITLRLDKPQEMIRIATVQVGTGKSSVTEVSRKDLQALTKDQSQLEVVERLGHPDRKTTDGVQVYEYDLTDGSIGRVAFGPGVIWVKVEVDGADIQLL